MEKIELFKLYRFGCEIKQQLVTGEPMVETWMKLSGPIQWLHSFLAQIAVVPAPKTRQAAFTLLTYLHDMSQRMLENIQAKIEVPINVEANVKIGTLIEAMIAPLSKPILSTKGSVANIIGT